MALENANNQKVQKPELVRITILILYAYVVIRFLITVTMIILMAGNLQVGGISIQLSVLIIEIFFIYLISLGFAWARDVWLAGFVMAGLFGLWEIFPLGENYRGLILISMITYAAGVAPIILLYLKPSRAWFKAARQL